MAVRGSERFGIRIAEKNDMAERPPDKVTHTETVADDGRVFYDTHMEWTVPPPEGVEPDWIDEALQKRPLSRDYQANESN